MNRCQNYIIFCRSSRTFTLPVVCFQGEVRSGHYFTFYNFSHCFCDLVSHCNILCTFMLTKKTFACVCEYDHPSHYLVNVICARLHLSHSLLYSTQLKQFEDHDTLTSLRGRSASRKQQTNKMRLGYKLQALVYDTHRQPLP